jgi:hypothetical protein
MLYQNPAIRSRVEVHLVEEAKGGPSKLLLSFLFEFKKYGVESFRKFSSLSGGITSGKLLNWQMPVGEFQFILDTNLSSLLLCFLPASLNTSRSSRRGGLVLVSA